MADSAYSIFTELNEWFAHMETWQQCALSLMIAKDGISETDLATIVSEFLWDKELQPLPKQRSSYALAVPVSKNNSHPVPRLSAIKSVVGVNALAPDQCLSVGRDLTVIYGPNGSGKSGYARLMKASCFTRSLSVDILGNIHVPADTRPVPSAVFELDGSREVMFRLGDPCPELRDNFAVFDSSCVRVHLDSKNTFNVTPYLFDIFPRMVDLIETLNLRLQGMILARTPDLTQFFIPGGQSEVSQLLANLAADSDISRLVQLARYGEDEAQSLILFEGQLDDLKKSDPATLIKQRSRMVEDLQTLTAKVASIRDLLNKTRATIIAAVREEIQALEQQAAAVSATSLSQEPLKPIGTQAWKALVLAAIEYNGEVYPGQLFPAVVQNVRCLLCHQPLEEDAKKRLERFFANVTSSIQASIADKHVQLQSLLLPLEVLDTSLIATDAGQRRTIEDLDPKLLLQLDMLSATFNALRVGMLKRDDSQAGLTTVDPETSVVEILMRHTARLQKEIEELRARNVQAIIATLTSEVAMLRDRHFLSTRLSNVVQAIENLRWIEAAKRHCPISHRNVTERQKKLVARLIGQGFRDRFRGMCESLGIYIPMDFKISGTEGEANRRLNLQAAAGTTAPPSYILSEGEQTAIAIADFLSEIEIKDTGLGIVFDDPVSSMDHQRKESIARTLAAAAIKRQVIVFTHDILFSHYLAAEAERIGGSINFTGRTVSRKSSGSIGCVDDVAFPHRHYEGQAVKRAREFLDKAKNLSGTVQSDYLEKSCGALRTAYEDFVLRRLFNDVVGRWRENIKYVLKGVYIDESIVARVDERMEQLSRHIDAHSHSAEIMQNPLTVDFVVEQLKAYECIFADYRKSKKKWEEEKSRKTFT
jgi:energy-coupling factor transporter ATP-binding protein EcfA2